MRSTVTARKKLSLSLPNMCGRSLALLFALCIAGGMAGALGRPAQAAEGEAEDLWQSFFGFPTLEESPAQPLPPPPPPPPVLPADITVQSAGLRLLVHKEDAAIEVKPLGSTDPKAAWRSDALGPDGQAVNEYWIKRLRSPVSVDVWNNGRTRTEFADPREHIAGVTRLADRVQMDFRFDALGISFSLVLRLGPDYLEVTVPAEKIAEAKPESPLVAVTPLPFFGAARRGDPGYLVLPDGPGVMISFERDLSGRDLRRDVFGDLRDALDAPSQAAYGRLNLPVYGVVRGADGMLAVLTAGAAEAAIGFVSSPEVIYTAANAQFLFRKPYRDLLRRDRVPAAFDPYDRQIRYYFITRPAAAQTRASQGATGVSYVDLAQRYRRHLLEVEKVPPLTARAASEAQLKDELTALPVRLFGGIKKRWERFAPLIVGTTFDQAATIAADLVSAGVERPTLTLVGWTYAGQYGELPRKLPPDRTLGGRGGLAALIRKATELGVRVGLEDNPLDAFSNSPDFHRPDLLKDELRLPVRRFSLFRRSYLISPARVERFAERDYPDFRALGFSGGVTLAYIAGGSLPDGDEVHPVTRRQSIEHWRSLAARARTAFSTVTVHGQNAYLIGAVDRMLGIPVSSDGFWYEDAGIPFFQLATHGLVQYGLEATNLRLDGTYQFLKMIEFGAIPWAELTYNRPTLWQNTPYRSLFSSDYRDWQKQLGYEYQLVYKQLAPLLLQFIDDHRLLAPDVTQTRYADGTRVVVNYGSNSFALPLARGERLQVAGSPAGFSEESGSTSRPGQAAVRVPGRSFAVVGR